MQRYGHVRKHGAFEAQLNYKTRDGEETQTGVWDSPTYFCCGNRCDVGISRCWVVRLCRETGIRPRTALRLSKFCQTIGHWAPSTLMGMGCNWGICFTLFHPNPASLGFLPFLVRAHWSNVSDLVRTIPPE